MKTKKLVSLLLAVVMAASVFALPATVFADTSTDADAADSLGATSACAGNQLGMFNGVPACVNEQGELHICANNFPDSAFREYLDEGGMSDSEYDEEHDTWVPLLALKEGSYVTPEIVSKVTIIGRPDGWGADYDLSFNCASLKGIEFFTSLTSFAISGPEGWALDPVSSTDNPQGKLTALNLSNNPNLTEVSIHFQNISSLDLSKNTKLTSLSVENTLVTALNIGNNPELKEVSIYHCPKLTSVDFGSYQKMESLSISECPIAQIDVRQLVNLKSLSISECLIAELDVRCNTELVNLCCDHTQILALDISNNKKLRALRCGGNQLSALDISDNPELKEFDCSYNNICELDFSHNQNQIINIEYDGNHLAQLDLTGVTDLQGGYSDGYQQTIDLTACPTADGKWQIDLSERISPENLKNVTVTTDGVVYDSSTGIITLDHFMDTVEYSYDTGMLSYEVFEIDDDDPYSALGNLDVDWDRPRGPHGAADMDVIIQVTEGHSHVASDWETTVEPTCTEPGSAVQKCTICGTILNQKELPALGHNFGAWSVVTPATCTATGLEKRVCTRCDAEETQVVPATGHSFGNWIVDKAPTATEPGSQHRECSVCGYRETKTLAPVQVRRKAQVMVSSLNVRSSASSSSASVVKLVKNELAYINGESGNWYLVSFTKGGKQYRGYLPKQYVKIIAGEAKDKGAVIAKSANVYTSTAANKVETTLDRELLVYIDGTAGDYYLVSFSWNGWHYGYVKKDYIRDASLPADYKSVYSSHQALVMTDEVIVRDADGNPVTVLYEGNKVYINDATRTDGKYKVSFKQYGEPFDGYVGKQYFRISSGAAKEKGAVIAKNANVYTSTAATKVESTLSRKLLVYIDQEVGDYYLVSFSWNGWHYGYILKDYVRDAGLPANYKSVYSSHQALVMTDEVIVRDADGNPVTVLYENNKVYINEVLDDGRYKVSFTQYGEPFDGYVGKQYFRISSGAAKPAGTITADVATIYTDTDKTSVESTLRKGLRVYIDKEEGDFYLVSFSWDGWHYGYIEKSQVRV